MPELSSVGRTGALDRASAMRSFHVACITHQGLDVIIVPVDSSFGLRPGAEQARTLEALQRCAAAAEMPGTVAAIWDDGKGRIAFRAPPPLHDFFRGIDMVYVATALNRELACD